VSHTSFPGNLKASILGKDLGLNSLSNSRKSLYLFRTPHDTPLDKETSTIYTVYLPTNKILILIEKMSKKCFIEFIEIQSKKKFAHKHLIL